MTHRHIVPQIPDHADEDGGAPLHCGHVPPTHAGLLVEWHVLEEGRTPAGTTSSSSSSPSDPSRTVLPVALSPVLQT